MKEQEYDPADIEKFCGPTYEALVAFAEKREDSLLRVVESRTLEQLAAIFIGQSVYEVYVDLPTCKDVLRAMEFLQAKQSRMHRERIQVWLNNRVSTKELTPNRKNYVIKPVDMRLFLDRFPMIALPKQMCKPFYNIIKNFLVNHLYKFKTNKRLYSRPPFFPPEKDLPDVVNAFGPTEHLEKNYPHLARTKHDMVMNIMHFMVTYSLDWICEVLTLKHDSRGYVKYSCPILDLEPREMYNADNGHGHSPSGSAPADRPPRAESNLPPQQEREQTEHVPGTSRRDALPSMSDLPDPQQPDEQDDWRDLVNIAMNDPNLPMHYKTMIQCLVTSNRDLKKVIASLEHTR